MSVEIERKFLVAAGGWRALAAEGRHIRQGYLMVGPVQVRIRRSGEAAYLTIKGPRSGISRPEFEYEIPADEAEAMFALCLHSPIDKTRYEVENAGHVWEIDVYGGRHAGLVIAEVELDDIDEAFSLPDWIGPEVSGDRRYSNAVLAGVDAPPAP